MTIDAFITMLTALVTGIINWTTAIMALFLQPPLVLFVGIGVVVALAKLIKSLIMKR